MKRNRVSAQARRFLASAALCCFSPAAARASSVKDVAGYKLGDVWAGVRLRYPDAALFSISGRTGDNGSVDCDPHNPVADGWRYHFYSAQKGAFLMMARCGTAIAGPLKEFRSLPASGFPPPIEGKFIDADRALNILNLNKISLDPTDHGGGGNRPFTLKLFTVRDVRFRAHPVFWEVRVGKDVYTINADTQKLLRGFIEEGADAGAGGLSAASAAAGAAGGPGSSVSSGAEASAPAGRVKRTGLYTAKTDLERAKRLAREKMPGSYFMAVDGIADAWGSATCAGPGDGWAYYFYYPKTRSVETVYACKGAAELAHSTYIPVDLNVHQPIAGDFIDSDRAFDLMLADEPDSTNEGLGRRFTRKATMRLVNYRGTQFTQQSLWSAKLLWEIEVGTNLYYVDALKGVYIGSKEKH